MPQTPGVTADQISLGVVLDINTGDVLDDSYVDWLLGLRAWAASVNARPEGLAGRKIALLDIDTLLFEHAEAVSAACRNPDLFALVGSSALFDGLGAEVLAGADCGMPDFPARVNSAPRKASPVTFLSSPFLNAVEQGGPVDFLAGQFAREIERTALMFVEFGPDLVEAERLREVAAASGYEFVFGPRVPIASNYSEVVGALANEQFASESLIWVSDGRRLARFLLAVDEADDAVRPEMVYCHSQCYGDRFLDNAGAKGEGVYTWIPHLPFGESGLPQEMAQYLFWLDNIEPEAPATSEGLEAWAAGRLFEESVNRAVRFGTDEYDPELLTRAAVVAGAQSVDDWDAFDIYGRANPAGGQPSPCYVLMQVQAGQWERVHPPTEGTLDCVPDNVFPLVATAELGLTRAGTSSTTSEAPAAAAVGSAGDLEVEDELPE